MTFKTFLFAGLAASMIASPSLAVTQSVIDSVVNDLSSQGYTHLRLHDSGQRLQVEAIGPNGQVELLYDAGGNLVRRAAHDNGGDRDGFFGATGAGADRNDREHGAGGSDSHDNRERSGQERHTDRNQRDHGGNDKH